MNKQLCFLERSDDMLVTKQAPNFSGTAFHEGKIKKVSLEDYRGKWVVLCFYPGDFTFV
jgi:peroxiredoxin (alkyl hydroperoxide reductase subunit C)